MDTLERARLINLRNRIKDLPLQAGAVAADRARQCDSIIEKMLIADDERRVSAARAGLVPPPPPPAPAVGHGERVGDRIGNLGEGS